jgi:hypothetical protein
MKNLTATLACFLFTLSLFAQYDSKGLLISTSLGFSKTESISPRELNGNSGIPPSQTISKTFVATPEISYVVSEKFMIGLGYFSSNSENSFNASNINFINGTAMVAGLFSNTNSSKTSGLTLHMRYSQNIASKLIVSLKFTYLNLKGESVSETTSTNQNNSNSQIQSNRAFSAFSLGETRFSPSIHYFISKNFGCYIETTGLNLRFSDSRKINKDVDYNFDLNPNTWRVGLFYFIPTQKASE